MPPGRLISSAKALHLKIDEVIRASARNEILDLEKLSDQELEVTKTFESIRLECIKRSKARLS